MAISSSATGLRPGVCTSTTRPSAPYTGQIIYQTDDGQMLVWNGSAWASLNPTANRNALINGAFDVWQRGTSFAAPANLTYTADRWFSAWGTAARTVSRQAGFSNAQYCVRVQRDSGSTSAAYTGINQIIESANCYQFQGKTVTLSFDARCGANYSSSGSTLLVYLQSGTAADQGASSWWSGWTGSVYPIATTVTLSTTAQRFTLTGTVASNALELAVTFQYLSAGTAGAADYFEVTNVQLEVGNQASAFERRSIGIEVELCQRYYYLHVSGYNKAICHGHYYSAAGFEGFLSFPTRMRTTPTLDYVQGTNYYNIYSTGNDLSNYVFLDGYSTDTMAALYDNATATGTAGYGGMYLTYNAASYVAFKAEL